MSSRAFWYESRVPRRRLIAVACSVLALSMPAVALHNVGWKGLARCRLGDWDGFMEDFDLLEQFLGERREAPPAFAMRPFGAAAFVHEVRGERAAADRLLAMLAHLYDDEGYQNASVVPWVALVGLQESAKGNGIAELVKDRLSFACAFEPVAEGDRIEFALEFL